MILRLLDKLGRKRIVMDRESNEPYLERYYLFLKDRHKFPFNIFLHKFLKSDPDDLHDHPWPYFTLILKGGYWEHVHVFGPEYPNTTKKVWRGPGHFRFCSAKTYHRIELEPGVTAWTLFVPGPQQRDWGFMTMTSRNPIKWNWVQHEQYINQRILNKGTK